MFPIRINYVRTLRMASGRMEGHKDISEMSFEEFFSEKDRMPVQASRPEPRRQRQAQPKGDALTGFGNVSPKINYKDGRFLLYIPRYGSDENARFEVAVDCPSGVVPLGRLDSSPRAGGRLSRSTTVDITSAGVSPLEPFTLVIDGVDAFRHKPRNILYFNNIGLPVGRPVGEVYAVHAKGTSLRTVKAEVMETSEVAGVLVTKAEVSVAGGIWLDDRKRDRQAQGVKADEPSEEVAAPEQEAEVQEAPRPKPKSRKKAKGSLKVPAGVQEAEASVDGVRLQIHRRFPPFTVSVENCELSECTVSLRDPSGNEVAGGNAPVSANMTFETESDGLLEIVLSKDAQVLASERFVYIPDFECSRPGKGDVPPDPNFTFEAFGERVDASIYDGPYTVSRNGCDITIHWNIPAVTYDIGGGPVRFEPAEVDVGDLGDTLVVTVVGAKKKALFFGGDKGKKRDITPDWTDDTYRISLDQIKEEIYSSNSPEFTLYMTVNSFPMRRFMTIRNPPRMSASFADGAVVAEISKSGDYVCRLYRMDKTVEEVPLQPGPNSVPVAQDVVEAEVAEVHGGKDRASMLVSVRPLPFLWKDEGGEYWLYVNRNKRIPLPGELVSAGKPDAARIRAWHDQILRMNPELRDVTTQMMQRAFDDMGW